ncbi:MAG: DUF3047 domain-containing protein [Polyangiaceae bacterium]|nr:DUF3047 domain-containing protein [Polyangiaceae bacterium]
MISSRSLCALGVALLVSLSGTALADTPSEIAVAPKDFRVVERKSGPVNYYRVLTEGTTSFIRGEYHPGLKTTVLGFQVPDGDAAKAQFLKWRWRAVTLPQGGDGCSDGKRDAAANVYLTWKRGLRWYTLKYVWTTVGTKGSVCDKKRNPMVAQDTVVMEVGSPLEWRTVSIDLRDEFRRHFANGDANADVPEFKGIGIMTDGDDTKSESAGDYADFVLVR